MAEPAHERRFPSFEKYHVLEELGHGGMATVYRAKDMRLGREVAIKVMHPHLRNSTEIAHRFFVEAQAVALLRHPNIVEVYDVSAETEADRFLVVELVRGTTLRKILHDFGPLPPEVAAAIAIELLQALGHAHAQGVVHRDVKPENVLIEVTPKDDNLPPELRIKIKLTDFGIAKLLDAQGVTATGQVLGSPAHMAPEQIEGGEVDARADVFGMGVLLYEAMVGHLPFEGTNPAQVLRRVLEGFYSNADRERPTVGAIWSQILDRALANCADNRYPDAATFREAIVAELERLQIRKPKEELAAFFDQPALTVSNYPERLSKVLSTLGQKAVEAKDYASAAQDYNRALAYTPDDAALMHIVAGMGRRAERSRRVRAILPYVGAFLMITGASYGAGVRVFRPPPPVALPLPPRILPVTVDSAPIPSSSVAVTPSSRPVLTVRPPVSTVLRPTMRALVFDSVAPPFGVGVSVDGDPPITITRGFRVTLDQKAHTLKFGCREDVCVPEQRTLPAGDRDEPMNVDLQIRPGTIVVHGDPSHSYQLSVGGGEPVRLIPEAATRIPFRKESQIAATVVELRSDGTKRERFVRISAGKEVSVSFVSE